jgi:hypothetical protein
MTLPKLNVGGLNIGDPLEVYSVMGQLLYQSVAHNEKENVILHTRGIYIVKSGNRILKVVY